MRTPAGSVRVRASGTVRSEQLERAGQWSAVADYQFEDLSELAGEDDEGENRGAQDGVRGDFAENVAGENAHGADRWRIAREINFKGGHGFARISTD